MISKLPAWVEWGAWLLAFNAGGINAVGLLSLEHQAISHITGSASWLGVELAEGRLSHALYLALVMLAFFCGATLTGWIIRDPALELGRRYSICLLIEAAFLTGAVLLFAHHAPLAALLASAACGLQNAMVTNFSGAIIRTTHLTGIVTDLGIALGHWLQGMPGDARRARLHGLVVTGFMTGAIGGAVSWLHVGAVALWLPVGICLSLSAAHAVSIQIIQHRIKRS
jgi:uncharacterized membrane protein YoaK (UPF0700 family)